VIARHPQFRLKGPMTDPSGVFLERRLAEQSALARFARNALKATERGPLLAEAAALVHRALPTPTAGAFEGHPEPDEDEVAFAESVADILEAASAKLRAAEASRDAALHDPLTGLANRSLILDHLHLALARASRRSTLAAVIFFDLNGFKRINDALGHAGGDDLLVRIAERLRPVVRPADTLGRWGGDEFVVVCEDLERASEAPAIAQRIAAAFEPLFSVQGMELHVAASIGVAVSAGGDDQPAALIDAADSAMYRAKQDITVGGRPGQETTVFPIGVWRPKLEGLAGHLLDLLSGSERPDTPAGDEESAPTGRTVA
jgi:diguanylate cyclase (GGDEF)-like protein